MPETSIIIRTFNEEKHLPRLLDAIRNQRYSDYEIIVVDSGSYDGTRMVAERANVRLFEISSRDFTFGYSLNTGIRQSAGRWAAIVSAHVLPVGRDWLENLVTPLRNEEIAMVYGSQRGVDNSNYAELQDFQRNFGAMRRLQYPPNYFANNANSAIRRSLWEKYSFDESLPGLEDIDWAKHWMERGCRVLYVPEAKILHIHDESWRQIFRRHQREAIAAARIGWRSRARIPLEVTRETGYLFGDLARAVAEGEVSRAPEIALYRFWKTAGIVSGLLQPSRMEDPDSRRAAYFPAEYRAVSIADRGRAEIVRREAPELRPGEALVKVAYTGVCGTDLEILDGTLGYFDSGLSEYPIIPGHEVSGMVVDMGVRADGLTVGDSVVIECIQHCGTCDPCRRGNYIGCLDRTELGVMGRDGGYAEYVVVPAHFLHRIPPTLGLKEASLCEPLAVVLKGLNRARAVLGDGTRRCAVVGAGPVGHLCAQVLSLHGHDVTGVDRDDRRLGYLRELDISVTPPGDDMRLDKFDFIVEATGAGQVLDTILHSSRAGSVTLLLGLPYSRRSFNFEEIVAFDKAVIGSVGSSREDFERALNMLDKLDLRFFLRTIVPLEEYEKAWRACRERHELKVILEVDSQLEQLATATSEAASVARSGFPGGS